MLEELVASGEYLDASAILTEALAHWQVERYFESPDALTSEELRMLWDEGVASGPAGPIDFDQLLQEAQERLQISLRRTA